jgi:serine/threonine protein phosphatase 1
VNRTFVIGDIHGRADALQQCLIRCKFDFDTDTLISLGDIADGGQQVYEVVEILLQIKNHIPIKGNHDDWFTDWILTGIHPAGWLQGGYGTLKSYVNNIDPSIKVIKKQNKYITGLNPGDLPETHITFWNSQIPKYVDEENRCFVHGGFDRTLPIREQPPDHLYWNRQLWYQAMSYEFTLTPNVQRSYRFKMVDDFKEVYIGHTTTECWTYQKLYKNDKRHLPIVDPIRAANIWNLDTGAKLTIMDINTKKYWQSDLLQDL